MQLFRSRVNIAKIKQDENKNYGYLSTFLLSHWAVVLCFMYILVNLSLMNRIDSFSDIDSSFNNGVQIGNEVALKSKQ